MDAPIGFHDFHTDANLNYEMNRLLLGGTPEMIAEIRDAASRIQTLEDYVGEMLALASKAERDGRLEPAMHYTRGAEFFMAASDPRKQATYERFVSFADRVWGPHYKRDSVPYGDVALPVLLLGKPESASVILIHGGFDSFIEEFVPVFVAFADAGFRVVAFEGPGQGALLRRHRLPMTHEWERPTTAVIEHFGLADVTLIGGSLGGYLALRAAAFEARIQRVVAFDVMYDFFDCVASRKGPVVRYGLAFLLSLGASGVIDALGRVLMRRDNLARWGIGHGMDVMGVGSPSAFFTATQLYRSQPISHLVKQDVLLLAGEADHFVPLRQLAAQARALGNARSVTTRIFRASENAASHCQIGNLPLVVQTMTEWITRHSGAGPTL
jgi:pimeloyl-ACP methyl ester carboxylesterase